VKKLRQQAGAYLGDNWEVAPKMDENALYT